MSSFREIPCNSVANASAWFCPSFRVFPCLSVAMLLLILPSVKFRVNPWQMLLLGFPLFLPSVANLLLPFTYFLDIKT